MPGQAIERKSIHPKDCSMAQNCDRPTTLFFWSLIALLVGLTGCTAAPTPSSEVEFPPLEAGNFPRMDGSTSTSPLGTLIGCRALGVPCEWVKWIDGSRRLAPILSEGEEFPPIAHNGTHSAYENLILDRADLILVARLPSVGELALADSRGIRLDPRPIALDAFVFLLHADNPVDSLTTETLQAIYSGEVTRWQALGGDDLEIHPYQRNENSGSQELMKALVMKDLPMVDAPEMLLLMKMIAPFYAVSEDPQGIGYSVYYYEERMAPNENVKLIAVDGILPAPDTIRSGAYPFTSEVYAVVRENLPPGNSAYQLRDWLLSTAGQDLIEVSGYVRWTP
jgi:phosphate transport system substrate-binding protein